MIKIAIFTATRAEYGLMRPLIAGMREDTEIDLRLLVTGTHLSEQYGMTYKEIEADGNEIAEKIPILSDKTGAIGVSETMGNALVKFTEYFERNKPDCLVIDGDRYEALAVAIAATNCNVPIVHLYGGATTEGAADECYRHAITKMSLLHFTSTEVYRNRIIQMGEEPDRVKVVGSVGLENIRLMQFWSKKQLEEYLDFELDKPYAVVTFHPVTLENDTAEKQMMELLKACKAKTDMKFIFTKANADRGGERINCLLDQFAAENMEQVRCVTSLGTVRYLSALKYCEFVMGNSSSGIIEAPSFGIPTVNIGDRQKGRIQAESILNCEPTSQAISQCIDQALDSDFRQKCKAVKNPNGDGYTSEKIINEIKEYYKQGDVNLKKKFFDLKNI